MNHTEPAYFYDPKLAKLIRDAERARHWYWRIDWHFIGGIAICITVAGLGWWGLIEAVIWANRWYQ